MIFLGLDGDLPRPVGDDVDQQIAAADVLSSSDMGGYNIGKRLL